MPGGVNGPLVGLKVLEFAGIGPGPFCAMLLSDMGADVLRIDRAAFETPEVDLPSRGRRSLVLDLKQPADVETALALVEKADVLLEGFRPGVMERLGLGPDAALARNPRLVFGRMTGWGQEGPLARAAAHDINYLALTGALAAIGPEAGPPVPPLNLVGDFGGGSLYLAMGVLAALVERERSGRGQVVDAAIVDGAASLMTAYYGLARSRGFTGRRGRFLLDGSAPHYRCYACADGKFVALGAVEPHFYARFAELAGIEDAALREQAADDDWAATAERLAAVFSQRTRDEWCALLEGTDACFAPVLEIDEAPDHPHNRARGAFLDVGGQIQPAPAPRFSRTPGAIQGRPPRLNEGGEAALRDWGVARS